MAGVRRFEDLVAWQRAHELSVEIWRVTEDTPAARDFRFRDQLRDASDSAARNVAEGFGRFHPGEFARFLTIARASVQEAQSMLRKGLAVGYWSHDEFERLDRLAERSLQSIARFQRYLRSPQANRNATHTKVHN